MPALTPLLPALTLPGARRCLQRWGRCRSPIYSQLPHFLPELQITVSHPPLPPAPLWGHCLGSSGPRPHFWSQSPLCHRRHRSPNGRHPTVSPSSATLCTHRGAQASPRDPHPAPPPAQPPPTHTLCLFVPFSRLYFPAIINPSCAKGWGCLEVGPQERVLPIPTHGWVGGTAGFGAVNPFLQPLRALHAVGEVGVIPPMGQGGRMPALTLPSAQDTAVAAAGKSAATFLETVFRVDQRNREELGISGSHSSLPSPPLPQVAQPHDPQSPVLVTCTVLPKH